MQQRWWLSALGAISILLAILLVGTYMPLDAQDGTPSPTPRTYPTHTPACPNTMPTRMIIHQRGRVSTSDPDPMNVRAAPGTDSEIMGIIPAGDRFYVLSGPRCTPRYTWYQVEYRAADTTIIGWVAEGADGSYFLDPYPPGH